MQVPILNGIYADTSPDFRTSYPHNMVPVPKANGISAGYLRPADGLVTLNAGLGVDRGGIQWRGECYRVQGTRFLKVASDGTVTDIADVGAGGPVTMDYSFDYLGIASGGDLFLYDGATLTQITDPDLGTVLSFVWLDGYFVTTDGEFLVVTELNDPFSVNPLKYGSSEIDPDPIVTVLKLRNEVYAVNSTTIEVFDNVGGAGFPFARINGAQIQRGSVGTHAACIFDEKLAFVGGGKNEAPSVYIGGSGQTSKISTQEIDEVLATYSTAELAGLVAEQRIYRSHKWLHIHLPDQTLVYDLATSAEMQVPVWFTLSGGAVDKEQYPARGFVWCYDKWVAGDPVTGAISEMVQDVSTHFGGEVGWRFGTGLLYNESKGALIRSLELVALTGAVALGVNPVVSTRYTVDGITYSQPKTISAGEQGQRAKRLQWRNQGKLDQWRSQEFYGTSDAHITISRLEAGVEGLQW